MDICVSVCVHTSIARARLLWPCRDCPVHTGEAGTPLCSGWGVSVCTRAGWLAGWEFEGGGRFKYSTEDGSPRLATCPRGGVPLRPTRCQAAAPCQPARRIFTCVSPALQQTERRGSGCACPAHARVLKSCAFPNARRRFFVGGGVGFKPRRLWLLFYFISVCDSRSLWHLVVASEWGLAFCLCVFCMMLDCLPAVSKH